MKIRKCARQITTVTAQGKSGEKFTLWIGLLYNSMKKVLLADFPWGCGLAWNDITLLNFTPRFAQLNPFSVREEIH